MAELEIARRYLTTADRYLAYSKAHPVRLDVQAQLPELRARLQQAAADLGKLIALQQTGS